MKLSDENAYFKDKNQQQKMRVKLYEVICGADDAEIFKELISSMCATDCWHATFLPHGTRSITGQDTLTNAITRHQLFIHATVSYSMYFLPTKFTQLQVAQTILALPGVKSIEKLS